MRGKMTDLSSYVNNLLKQGYTAGQIKSLLLRYGYPERAVNQAIYQAGHPAEIKHTFHITKTSLAAIIITVVGLISASFFFFSGDSGESLLDVRIDSLDDEAETGGILSAIVELSNMGSDRRVDVFLKSEIFPENDMDDRLTFKSETVALETTKSHNVVIRIPKDAEPGRYVLQVRAIYHGQKPAASEVFEITGKAAEASCSDGILNHGEEGVDCGGPCRECEADKCPGSCDDNDDSTVDYCDAETGFRCVHEKGAECGDGNCAASESLDTCPEDCQKPVFTTIWDELDRIGEKAKSDPRKAEQECTSLEEKYLDECLQRVGEISSNPGVCDRIGEQRLREKCFFNVAKSLDNKLLCENIQHEDRRNSCYVYFASNGDYSVCDKITNEYVRKSCNTLKQTAT
ncbi:hypothetical protein GF323_00505 [Candidatus Woesearchaeota archaeon]|nr:hypothetical protein [Candidatus Woesearchaeota archaeon]